MTVAGLLMLVALPLLLMEIGPWGGWLAKRLLSPAALLRYGRTSRRSIRAEEWSRHLQEIPAPLSQLAYALGHLLVGSAAAALRIVNRARHRRGRDRDALLRAVEPSVAEDPDLQWQAFARCARTDPETFFSQRTRSVLAAKEICGQCEVKAECLQYALDYDERFGVWGGLDREGAQAPPTDSGISTGICRSSEPGWTVAAEVSAIARATPRVAVNPGRPACYRSGATIFRAQADNRSGYRRCPRAAGSRVLRWPPLERSRGCVGRRRNLAGGHRCRGRRVDRAAPAPWPAAGHSPASRPA